MRSTAEIQEIESIGSAPEQEASTAYVTETTGTGGVPLSLLQAVVCVIIILALVAVKLTQPSAYDRIREWYKNEMTRTVELPGIAASADSTASGT